jgi:hypothetical protein
MSCVSLSKAWTGSLSFLCRCLSYEKKKKSSIEKKFYFLKISTTFLRNDPSSSPVCKGVQASLFNVGKRSSKTSLVDVDKRLSKVSLVNVDNRSSRASWVDVGKHKTSLVDVDRRLSETSLEDVVKRRSKTSLVDTKAKRRLVSRWIDLRVCVVKLFKPLLINESNKLECLPQPNHGAFKPT